MPDPRSITVSVWDQGVVVSVEKAIRNAGLGLNPVVEGQNLRIPIPPLTEERRRDLAKLAGKYAEQQRIAVRNVRREAMDDLKKAEKDGSSARTSTSGWRTRCRSSPTRRSSGSTKP